MILRRDGRAEVAELRTVLEGGAPCAGRHLRGDRRTLGEGIAGSYLFIVPSDSANNSSRAFCLKRRTILIMCV